MRPSERRAVLAVALVAMLRMFGLFALLPVLAVYAAGLEGATPLLIGLAVGGYGLTQASLQIPFGSLSDRLGRRPVIWLGLAIFAAGSAIAGLSDGIHGVVLGRFLQGAGAVSASLTALLADVTRPEVRTRSMAVYGVGIGSSFLIALVLGPVFAAAFGVRSLFWFVVALSGLAAIVLGLVPPGDRSARAASTGRIRDAFLPRLLVLDGSVLALHAILTALFVGLPLMLEQRLGLPLKDHWLLYVAAVGASLTGTIPLILLDERHGKPATTAAAIGLLLGGLLLLLYAVPAWWAAFAALALFFAGFNFLEASLPARLSLLAPLAVRGSALGVFASAQFLGAFVGGLGGGLLLQGSDTRRVFLACGGVALAWLLMHILGSRRA